MLPFLASLRRVVFLALLLLLSASALCAAPLPGSISLDSGWRLQDAAKVSEKGEAISQNTFRADKWYAAVVPGTVLTSLVRNGVYPEPLYGENNRPDRIPESLCRTSYWYRRTFVLPSGFRGKQVWLNFEGINYCAEVWLNGRSLGQIQGAFARGLFNATAAIRQNGPNSLAVHILPPPHPGTPREQTLGNGYGSNGGDLENDTPTFVAAGGWDWIPAIRDRNMGIWQSVTLSASGPVTIQDPNVVSTLPLPRIDSADLKVEVTLRNSVAHPITGTLIGTIAGREFRRSVTLSPNASQTITLTPKDSTALHLDHPKLWWPNGYGPQSLYKMLLRFVTANGAISDTHEATFGVRSITYFTPLNPGKLTLTINGQPILVRGGNWGMDEAMKRSPHERLEAQIRLHKEVGYTMIRNWVGQTTQEDFYALCDKYGILVWDDYWLDDTTRPIPGQMFLANAREKLLRYRIHPCIAVWCGRNEFPVDPPFEKELVKLTHDLDPQRYYQPISSDNHGVGGHGSYGVEPVEYYFKPYTDSFHTEIGAPSIPTLEALHKMMPRKDWGSLNDDWAEHDMCQFKYPHVLTERYGPIADTNDFVRKAQLSGYEGYRAMYEGRNAKMFQPASGVLIWMSNPAQPSMVWQIYSYDLEPNSTYFGVKKACERIHVQMTPTGHIQVINNTPTQQRALTVTASLYNLDGTKAESQAFSGIAELSAATDFGDIRWPTKLTSVHFVRLTLRNRAGRTVSDNFYWHTTPESGQDCSALQTLPTVVLDVSAVQKKDTGATCHLDVTVRNPTRSVALLAHLQLRQKKSGERVLPVYYSDNYLSLLPGETRVVTIEVAKKDLKGDHPLLSVDGWNVTVAARKSGKSTAAIDVVSDPEVGVARVAEVRNIRCGDGWLEGYTADCLVAGGGTVLTDNRVDTKADPLAGPELLYRSERYGDCTYTIPLPKDRTYRVRLHFAETKYDQPGKRIFGIDINGKSVLRDFDIFTAAGGKDRALVRTFDSVRPDASGNITIHLVPGAADLPKICGIQILADSPTRRS
jgi:hypothetical protein